MCWRWLRHQWDFVLAGLGYTELLCMSSLVSDCDALVQLHARESGETIVFWWGWQGPETFFVLQHFLVDSWWWWMHPHVVFIPITYHRLLNLSHSILRLLTNHYKRLFTSRFRTHRRLLKYIDISRLPLRPWSRLATLQRPHFKKATLILLLLQLRWLYRDIPWCFRWDPTRYPCQLDRLWHLLLKQALSLTLVIFTRIADQRT